MSSIDGGGGVGFVAEAFDLVRPGRACTGGTVKCFAPQRGSTPSRHSRCAFRLTAERLRFNCAAICLADAVGHRLTSSVVSSVLQVLMAENLNMKAGTILAICIRLGRYVTAVTISQHRDVTACVTSARF